jgi:hypothetical protein
VSLAVSIGGTVKSAKEWYSRKEAAGYLASIGCPVSVRMLENRAANNNAGRGPSFTRIGWRMVKYHRRDLDAWAYAQTEHVK